jgi:hypothetical protein
MKIPIIDNYLANFFYIGLSDSKRNKKCPSTTFNNILPGTEHLRHMREEDVTTMQ